MDERRTRSVQLSKTSSSSQSMFISSISYFAIPTMECITTTPVDNFAFIHPQQLNVKANEKTDKIIKRILELYVCNYASCWLAPHVIQSFSQQSTLADAAPPSSPSAEPCRGSQPTTNSRKDKGKSKKVEIADVEQLKGSSGEFSSSHTHTVSQPAFTTTIPLERKKKTGPRRKKPKTREECSVPQNHGPNQTNDSHECHEGKMVHLVRVFGAENLCFTFQFDRSSLPPTAANLL